MPFVPALHLSSPIFRAKLYNTRGIALPSHCQIKINILNNHLIHTAKRKRAQLDSHCQIKINILNNRLIHTAKRLEGISVPASWEREGPRSPLPWGSVEGGRPPPDMPSTRVTSTDRGDACWIGRSEQERWREGSGRSCPPCAACNSPPSSHLSPRHAPPWPLPPDAQTRSSSGLLQFNS
jgi:hypothetical protein